MSPSTAERPPAPAAGTARPDGVRARVARAWASARGRVQRHVAYLQADRVRSWPLGSARPEAAVVVDSFAAWCQAHAGTDVVLHVAGPLTRSLAVDAALPLREPEALRRYVRQQFAYYHGARAAEWPLATWRGGATALHGIDLGELQSAASAHDVRLASVAPTWAAGLDSVSAAYPEFGAPGRHALLLVEGVAATWLVAQDGRVVSVRQRYLDAAHIDDICRLLRTLVGEDESLAGPPIVAGWDVEAPRSLPGGLARAFGSLENDGILSHWLRGGTP